MERLDRETQPTRQVSTALAQTASGQNDQNRRKRDFSAANDEHCDAKVSCSGCARRDEPQQHKASTTIGVDAFAPPIGERAPLSKGAAAPEIFEDCLDDGVKSAAPAAKKLFLRAPGDEPRLAASALADGLVLRDPGGSLQNSNVGWRMDLPGVERAAPAPAPRLEWRRFFPLLGVSPASDGSGLSFLPQAEASPVAQLLLQLDFLRRSDRNSINYTSGHVVTAVGEVQSLISECGYDWSPKMQQKLETTLNSSANVEYALRYATMALNFLVREVLLYLAPDAAPLDQLATVESTKKGAFCDSYDQIGLLHELALIFSRFPTKMQKRGGLGAVHRALRGGRASPPPPTSAASLSSVGTTPSATIAAADSSSVTVATLSSARDATMEPVCPPLPPVPPTSSSLGGTLPSTESVAPSSSLTNNVKPTSDTAASTKAYPSEGALADLRRRLASRENKDNSLGATAMVVDEKSSAPDPQDLSELIENYSFDVPDGSEALTRKDIKIGDVLYTVPINNGSMPLCRVEKISGGYVHVKDSTNNGGGKASKPRPGMLRRASRDDVNRFPPKDGPLTEAPLLATPPPPISLPPNDIITKVVDGLRCLLLERDLRFGGYGDKERRRMQSPVETVSDALDLLQFVVCTLDGALSAIDGDRKRTIGQKSLDTFNREVRPLVLFESLRSLLKEWAKVPEHVRPPFLTTPVAQASNDSILTKPRDRKTTERLADDLDAQKSSYCARYAVRPETEASCANCGVAFTYTGHEHRWKCSKDDCKKVFCGECAGLASQQPLNSKWVCRLCKSSEPIDVVKPSQTSGSLIHGSKIRLLVTGRIRLALGEDYEPYCKYMGPKFGSKAWYDLEVLTGAYKGKAACRRFTKSTEGTSNILIDWEGNGVFPLFDEFWDYCREPGETPLQVAERMTVEVHPGFEVIAGLFRWGVLDYLDGAKGGFVGGWRMQKLRDDHGVGQSSMPTVSDFLALPYQECLERLNDLEWPTPELKDMFCEYGAEEARRLAISGPDVPAARQPAQGPGSRNHAPETPAVIVADREERGVRERATLEFFLAFKAGRLHAPAMQVIDGLHRISGWLSIACADGNLGADQHIKQQTPLYLAAVRVRELMGEDETRGPFIRSPLNNFLNTGAGDGSDLDKLRQHWNVFMGASWRARYRETPTSEYKYVELTAVWEKHDPAARAAGPEALPAPSFRAPRSRN